MARGKRKASKTPTPTTEDAPDDQSLQERAEASKAAEERTRKAAAARMKCNRGKTPRTRATLEKKAVQDDEESETNEENAENEENEGKEGDDEVVDKDGEGEDDGEGDDVTDSDDEREAREHIDQFFGLKLPDRSRNRELWQKALVQVFKRLGRAGRRLEEVELRVDNLEDKAGRGAGRRTTRGWMISSGLDMNAADKAPVL